ncbi:MAG: hypothetical protein QG667_1296, partial [Pseudomonadota bacterium]|nr:hypothetical protein [Pseudomonadota bacterium]
SGLTRRPCRLPREAALALQPIVRASLSAPASPGEFPQICSYIKHINPGADGGLSGQNRAVIGDRMCAAAQHKWVSAIRWLVMLSCLWLMLRPGVGC